MTEPTSFFDAADTIGPEGSENATQPSGEALAAQAAQMLSPAALETLIDQLTAPVRAQRDEYQRLVEAKQDQIYRLMREQAAYEAKVRDALIRFTADRGVDNDEINELLAELDLDPVTQEYEVDVVVTGIQHVRVTVSATSAQAAQELVNDGDDDVRRLVDVEISGYNWDVEEYEASEVNKA